MGMTTAELEKLQHEVDVQNFKEWFAEVRWKVELMGAYGYSIEQAVEVLKLLELESIDATLGYDGDIVRVLEDLNDKVDELTVKNGECRALAITGEVNTY